MREDLQGFGGEVPGGSAGERGFRPGFRLSKADMGILLIGTLTTAALAPISVLSSLVVAFVVGHFFLFCNVFRISRWPEVIWAFSFVVLVALSVRGDYLDIRFVFLLQIALTIVLILLEFRKPGYHGLGWQRVNPVLDDWYRGRRTEEEERCQ